MPKYNDLQMTKGRAVALAILALEQVAEQEKPAHGGYTPLQREVVAARNYIRNNWTGWRLQT